MDAVAPEFTCPKCHSEEFYRSRTRTFFEKLVKVLTPGLFFRCRACGWRGLRVNSESWLSWRARFLNRYAPVLVFAILVWLLINAAGDLPPIFRPRKKSELARPRPPAQLCVDDEHC
jgi:predicted RNA-binding Zn-ribbon protein involved in translation (DUF1610 family)